MPQRPSKAEEKGREGVRIGTDRRVGREPGIACKQVDLTLETDASLACAL